MVRSGGGGWRLLAREVAATLVILVIATLAMHTLLYFVPQPEDLAQAGGRGPRDYLTRYLEWGAGAIALDFGDSPYTNRSINPLVQRAVPRTLILVVLGLGASLVVHLGVGWRLAFARGRLAQTSGVLLSGLSLVPVYVLAFELRGAFGGMFLGGEESMGGGATVLLGGILAILLVLSNGLFSESIQTLSTVLRREAAEPYVQSLVARRIPAGWIILRNSSGVLLATAASQLPRLITAVFIVEWAFDIQGVGYEALRAFDYTGRRDVPVIMAMTFLSVLLIRLVLVGQRLAVAWLNPRLSLER